MKARHNGGLFDSILKVSSLFEIRSSRILFAVSLSYPN